MGRQAARNPTHLHSARTGISDGTLRACRTLQSETECIVMTRHVNSADQGTESCNGITPAITLVIVSSLLHQGTVAFDCWRYEHYVEFILISGHCGSPYNMCGGTRRSQTVHPVLNRPSGRNPIATFFTGEQ